MEFMILALISVFAFFLVRFALPAAILLAEIAHAAVQAIAGDAKHARKGKALRRTPY